MIKQILYKNFRLITYFPGQIFLIMLVIPLFFWIIAGINSSALLFSIPVVSLASLPYVLPGTEDDSFGMALFPITRRDYVKAGYLFSLIVAFISFAYGELFFYLLVDNSEHISSAPQLIKFLFDLSSVLLFSAVFTLAQINPNPKLRKFIQSLLNGLVIAGLIIGNQVVYRFVLNNDSRLPVLIFIVAIGLYLVFYRFSLRHAEQLDF